MQEIDKCRLETGGDLYNLAKIAREWFITNNIEVPKHSKVWQKLSVRRGEIPPGTNVGALRRLGITSRIFIQLVNGVDAELDKYKFSIINEETIISILGLKWLSYTSKDGVHKVVNTECCKCGRVEEINMSTLTRMSHRGDKYCRICRAVGGKPKELSIYDKFEGFSIIGRGTRESKSLELHYKCNCCNNIIKRSNTHVVTAEYLVCEYCNPKIVSGARVETENGIFASKIEHLAYLKLVELLPNIPIYRQVSYNVLFNTGTKHTADFYIPKLDLVLEVTSSSNNLAKKYHETAAWKLSVSSKVKFAYSIRGVEDIVRPLLKDKGLTVSNRRSLLCRSIERRS